MKIEENGTIKNFLQYDELKNSRFLKPPFYARNGAAIYIVSSKCLMKKNSIFGDHITPYFMSKDASIDIDDQFDFEIAEMILKKGQN